MIRPLLPGWTRPIEAAEGTDELREALVQFLYDYGAGQPEPAADALLAGPLAPLLAGSLADLVRERGVLLARVQAIEALHQPWHRGRDGRPVVGSVAPEGSDSSTWCVHLTEPWPCATRRALDGDRG